MKNVNELESSITIQVVTLSSALKLHNQPMEEVPGLGF